VAKISSIAALSPRHELKVVRISDGKSLLHELPADGADVMGFSTDGKLLACALAGSSRIWAYDLAAMRALWDAAALTESDSLPPSARDILKLHAERPPATVAVTADKQWMTGWADMRSTGPLKGKHLFLLDMKANPAQYFLIPVAGGSTAASADGRLIALTRPANEAAGEDELQIVILH